MLAASTKAASPSAGDSQRVKNIVKEILATDPYAALLYMVNVTEIAGLRSPDARDLHLTVSYRGKLL